jgi:hypothetical protein
MADHCLNATELLGSEGVAFRRDIAKLYVALKGFSPLAKTDIFSRSPRVDGFVSFLMTLAD